MEQVQEMVMPEMIFCFSSTVDSREENSQFASLVHDLAPPLLTFLYYI